MNTLYQVCNFCEITRNKIVLSHFLFRLTPRSRRSKSDPLRSTLCFEIQKFSLQKNIFIHSCFIMLCFIIVIFIFPIKSEFYVTYILFYFVNFNLINLVL
uniref:Uncharacterized protein n=1 Tax=Cacopsylla melanoneura TaxID=428564 RepID=A0A8D8WMX1_9HEMI